MLAEVGAIPQKLYRYVGVNGERWEHLRQVLLHRSIYYSSRTRFNDPFDLSFQLPDTTDATLKEWIEEGFRMNLPPMPIAERELIVAELTQSTLPEGVTKEFRELYVASINAYLDNVAVLCLSARPDILLMWSHYSEGGKGVVLEFDTTTTTFLRKVTAMNYTAEMTPHSHTGPVFKRAERLLHTKSDHWAYEEEYRAFRNVPANSCADFPPGALVGLILGPSIAPNVESQIRALVEEAPDEITLYRAVKSADDFKLLITKD